MKKVCVATAIVLAIVFMFFTGSAQAGLLPSFGTISGGTTGSDGQGDTWLWNTTIGGVSAGVPAGWSAWGIPGLGQGETVWNGPTVDDFDFELTDNFTLPSGIGIVQTVGPAGGYTEYTRFEVNGIDWTEVFPGSRSREVEFFAPAGDYLMAGDSFFVNVVLDGTVDPTVTSWIGTYSTPSAVPLPTAVLLFAPGLAGLALIRRRFK